MPIYEYRCASCGFQKEFLQKVSDPLHTVCPECGEESFRKMLTAAGFQLKGSGWYATDFKNNGSRKTGAKSTETKSEDKPAAETKSEPSKSEPSKSEDKGGSAKSAETSSASA